MPTLPDHPQTQLRIGFVTNHPTNKSLYKDLCAMGHEVVSEKLLENPEKYGIPDLIVWDVWEEPGFAPDALRPFEILPPDYRIPVLGVVSERMAAVLAQRAFAHPTAWLLRPVRLLQLQLTLRTLARVSNANPPVVGSQHRLLPNAIFLRDGTRFRRLPLSDILYLVADRRYCQVVTEDKPLLHTLPLQNLLEQLPPDQFMRVHRSYAVQINAITALSTRHLYVGNKSIPIGELYKDSVRQKLFRFALKSS